MGLLLIAKDNIKKKKGNAFILFLLIALAVLLLYTGISVLSNLGVVIDNRNAATNGADYFLFTTSTSTKEINDLIKGKKETAYLESEKAIYASGTKFYNGRDSEKDADQLDYIFLNKDTDRKLATIELIDQGKEWKEDSIILPYYMKVGMGYKTGDIIKLVYNNQTYSFEIYGFTEDVMFSTPTNISIEKCFISSQYFNSFSSDFENAGMFYRADLKEGSDTEKYEENLNQELNEAIPNFQNLINWSGNYNTMKYGASITANIFMAVLTVFAILLILISVVIVHFNISNSIEMNMKNIGILEASGYTGRQMIGATVMEFMIISAFGICAGLLGASCSSKLIGGILSSSIGLRWGMGADVLSGFLSIAITVLLILIASLVCSRKFKKITPLDALRNGVNTHNFRKNQIQLEAAAIPIDFALGLKSLFYNKKKNIAVCFIIIVLTFCANEAVSIYQNLALKENKLIEIAGFEVPDITVDLVNKDANTLEDAVKEVKQKAASVKGIKQILQYTSDDIICKKGDKEVTVNFDVYENTDNLRVDNVVEGRRPKYDNEIMLSTVMSKKLGISIGDIVYLEMNGERKDYLLVGQSQGISHLGRKAMLTKEGIQRLNPHSILSSLYIYTESNINIDSLITDLKEKLTGEEVMVTNYQDYISASMDSITAVMNILCVVMLTVVILVIALVMFLLIKIQLVRDRKQQGIYKAMGFTTGQLIMQTVMSYIPVVFLGTVLGCAVAWFGVSPSFILCLSAFGIKKCSMNISIVYMVGIIAGIVIWASLITVLCSIRIRKIVPWEMIQEI